jgi:neutral ceramidase
LLLAFATSPAVSPAEPLRVGVAETDITPPDSYRKGGGYGEVFSTGVHDPLKAKALVLAQGTEKAALVICDLLSVSEPLSTTMRKRASDRTGIPESNIIIAATHNHGSPEYWGPLRDLFHARAIRETGKDWHEPSDYKELLVYQCVIAIADANSALKEARAELFVARQEGLAYNRRYHMKDGSVRFNPGKLNPDIVRVAGPVDEDLPFLSFHRKGAPSPFAALTVFAMHTATYGGAQFGADFPGHLQTLLRGHFGTNFISVFGEGTAGDVNHINFRSGEKQPGDTEPQRIGGVLAQTIVSNLPQSHILTNLTLAVRSATVSAPIIPVDEAQFHRSEALLLGQKTNRAAFLQLVAAWRDCHRWEEAKRHGAQKPLEVQAIRLNAGTAIVTLPHEIFVELGMAIKASSPFRHTLVISLANDLDFYIPTRRAFEEGSYEVTTCPLAAGCGELLVQTAVRLLNELKP